MKTNVFDELKRFQEDRLLNKREFNIEIASINILEELFEAHGVNDNDDRDVARMLYSQMTSIVESVKNGLIADGSNITYVEPTDKIRVDSFCDIQVFADGENRKIGYDNEKCMLEVSKEINSREGRIIDGKFVKFKTPEYTDKWYKADFTKCKES